MIKQIDPALTACLCKIQFYTSRIEPENEYIRLPMQKCTKLMEVFAKQPLTHLKRHVRGNTSSPKLSSRKKSSLKLLKQHWRQSLLSLKLEGCAKLSGIGDGIHPYVKPQETANFCLTHLTLQNTEYIQFATADERMHPFSNCTCVQNRAQDTNNGMREQIHPFLQHICAQFSLTQLEC